MVTSRFQARPLPHHAACILGVAARAAYQAVMVAADQPLKGVRGHGHPAQDVLACHGHTQPGLVTVGRSINHDVIIVPYSPESI